MKRIILFAAGLAFALSAAAQPGDSWPEPGQQQPQMKSRLTVEPAAQLRTDQMAAEIPLTDKQIKKVYNFFKRDIKYRREHFQFSGPRPGGPRPEGGPGMGPGGQRPSGPPSGMGPGGQRPQGSPGMGPGTPPPGFSPVDPEEIERYNARQEKKLRKIIGDQNYVKWRANHPAGKI